MQKGFLLLYFSKKKINYENCQEKIRITPQWEKKQIEWEKKSKSSKSLVYFFSVVKVSTTPIIKKERTFLKVKHIINNKYMIPFLS